jgi:predicted RNase H-related nuclease YkuK (DUF458 family)
MKKISIMVIFGLMVVGLMGCQTTDELSRFQRQTERSINAVAKLDDQSVETFDNNIVITNQTVVLSQSISQSSLDQQNKIEVVQNLVQAIVATRFENIDLYEQNQQQRDALKTNIMLFKEEGFELTDEDKHIIKTLRTELVVHRDIVLVTKGEVKDLLQEIEGKFNLEHIDLVIENLTKVLEILQLRQTFLIQLSAAMTTVNDIASTYLN